MIFLAGLALIASSGARAADESSKPAVGGEILVAPEAGASKVQLRPSAAFNGEVYLVTWQDGVGTLGLKACEIWAARLDKSGKQLDEKGILVCKVEGKEMRKKPVVAACGEDFLVVWEDYRNGKDYDLYAARVTGDGKVLDPNGFVVSAAPGVQVMSSVASDGKTGWLATWADFRSGKDYDAYAARISPDGKVMDPDGLAVATGRTAFNAQWHPSVVWGDGAYLLHWRISDFMYLARVTTDGKITSALDGSANPETRSYTLNNEDAKKAGPGAVANNASSENRSIIATGPGGCVTMQLTHSGKSWSSFFAYLMERDGKPHTVTNKEYAPDKLMSTQHNNPGLGVRPINVEKNDEVSELCAAPLGKDFLIVAQLRRRPDNRLESKAEDSILACRVQMDGNCPDYKTGWITIEATPGYNKSYPNTCGGPDGECLVVYERDKDRGDHKVAARIVKCVK